MALTDFPEFAHVDRTHVSVVKLTDSDSDPDTAYWHSRTPHERLRALEFLRQVAYGYDPATARLQRVLAVARHEGR
ncbi:MAG: hypothetical protein FJX75_16985 [Armatimonadetes bacterium]|nr:hypothetical protein [Armatimonadota bacterium]